MYRMTAYWYNKNQLENVIRYIQEQTIITSEGIMQNVADKAVDDMRSVIVSSRIGHDKGTHNLENSITTVEIRRHGAQDMAVGIGDVQKMFHEAPYWHIIDVGGLPPPNIGFWDGATWVHTGKAPGSYLMIPKNPIVGIDYIGYAWRNIEKNIDQELKSIGIRYIEGLKKASD